MDTLSPETEQEIARRIAAGPYASADELLRNALRALDDAESAAGVWLEAELLKGLEGEDVEMSDEEWSDIEQEARQSVRSDEGL